MIKSYSPNFKENKISTVDIVLIGSGIMSITLGMFLKILKPNWIVHIYERLDKEAKESSNVWNNAGTGHAAFCELNYTSLKKDNSIDISKAISINESFEISLQFWSFLVKNKILNVPETFIRSIPHISFVCGKKNINFLHKRFNTLKKSKLFSNMQYSEDHKEIEKWIPLLMKKRNISQEVAATKMKIGTDINFEEITRQISCYLKKDPNFNFCFHKQVIDIEHNNDNTWNVISIQNNITSNYKYYCKIKTRYVFIGAGGASLSLLQKSGIPESKRYAGFPIGGQFLVTENPKIINMHYAKVYGKSALGDPPMSAPHIDTRVINNRKFLFFGPFATFNSKFLKFGSKLDFFKSITKNNIFPMLKVGINNFNLVKYLINQSIMSNKYRLKILKEYYPQAKINDWYLFKSGQRVQIIEKDYKNRALLKFGTKIVSSSDGSLTALLGASPGASMSASIAISLLKLIIKDNFNDIILNNRIKEIVPSYGQRLNGNIELINEIHSYISKNLNLVFEEVRNKN